MREVIELAHSHDIPVLVDEAHGAHFIAKGNFPMSALEMGADVVVQSAHKTLPALTMGSYLHIQSNRVSSQKSESLFAYASIQQSLVSITRIFG